MPNRNLDFYLLVARILLVLIFPLSGWAKLDAVGPTTAYLTTLGAPMPPVAVWLAIAAEFVLPALVIIGLFTRWAALGLILYTAATMILAHRFWDVPAAQAFGQQMHFFKNLSMMAGLGFVVLLGPGRYAFKPGS